MIPKRAQEQKHWFVIEPHDLSSNFRFVISKKKKNVLFYHYQTHE
jgi:hypothetical protein